MFDQMSQAAAQPGRPSEDECFEAFAKRDKGLRDAFVMAVKTTGVYCRAGCAARTPLRKNVRFFDTAEEARAAGFRACKRCKPDDAGSPNAAMIARACREIEDAETPPGLEALAARAGLSPFHFHRLFKAETGVTPTQYASAVRDRRAKAALKDGASVTEAVYHAGYGSASRFYDGAKSRFGMAPKAWREKGRGEDIRVATAPCALGQVLVAATEKGVCAIELGDDAEAMQTDFRRRFSNARAVEGDRDLETLVAKVVALVEAPSRASEDLPLDVRGTAFQHQVWDALRKIPAGRTLSYAELARAIGKPRAVRAVGSACGANPTAVVVPCHRVVGASGSLAGYRWGVERKRELLKREGGAPRT
jgi:AraC family transcriptional regulator of adaptative response/methylated-DNA-[protein]-cysteine methyltransferase